jgi:hypothetical protein
MVHACRIAGNDTAAAGLGRMPSTGSRSRTASSSTAFGFGEA